MAFVNRFVHLDGDAAANATAVTLETFTVREGATVTTVGLYTNENTNLDYSLKVNETTVMDAIPGDELPNAEDPLRYEIQLHGGDDLNLVVDNNTGSSQTGRMVFMVEDTSGSFPDAGG